LGTDGDDPIVLVRSTQLLEIENRVATGQAKLACGSAVLPFPAQNGERIDKGALLEANDVGPRRLDKVGQIPNLEISALNVAGQYTQGLAGLP